jgi:hypothetical protein
MATVVTVTVKTERLTTVRRLINYVIFNNEDLTISGPDLTISIETYPEVTAIRFRRSDLSVDKFDR